MCSCGTDIGVIRVHIIEKMQRKHRPTGNIFINTAVDAVFCALIDYYNW